MESDRPLPGIVFDIDGVLVLDKAALPTAAEVIQFIKKPLNEIDPEQFSGNKGQIPFACLTNGGGMLEITKAENLNSILGLKEGTPRFHGKELLLNYTPLRPIMSNYHDRLVIVTGVGTTEAMIRDFGLNKYVTIEEYATMYPAMVPVTGKEKKFSIAEEMRKKIGERLGITDLTELEKPLQVHAVFIVNDPPNWYEYMQIICDLLTTTDGQVADKIPREVPDEHIPVYCTNNDLVYAGAFHLPRLTFGAFNEALKHIYQTLYKKELKLNMYGKPFQVTYQYAEKYLQELAKASISRMYMVGDNPKSDIRGARASGWTSILVETGVFKKTDSVLNDSDDPADYVVKDAKEAIKLICKLENIKCDLE